MTPMTIGELIVFRDGLRATLREHVEARLKRTATDLLADDAIDLDVDDLDDCLERQRALAYAQIENLLSRVAGRADA